MKKYIVKFEYRYQWNTIDGDINDDNDWIVTEDEIRELADPYHWDVNIDELLEQVEEIN